MKTKESASALVMTLALLTAVACTKKDAGALSTPAPQDTSEPVSAGATDPAHDWEHPPHVDVNGPNRDGNVDARFESARTLADTTKWLHWALERYGEVHEAADWYRLRNVNFSGCEMSWAVRRFMNGGQNIEDYRYTVNLKDIDLTYGAIRLSRGYLTFGNPGGLANSKIRIHEQFYTPENGEQKPNGERTSMDASAVIQLQDKDDIVHRAGWALAHAGRLCGGNVPPPGQAGTGLAP